MPRQPKLRKKKIRTYWFTEAGESPTYLSYVDEVSYDDARRAFSKHIFTLDENEKGRKRAVLSAGELMDLYLDWVQKNRSGSSYENCRTHLTRFGAFIPEGRTVRIADVAATRVTGGDLQASRTRRSSSSLVPSRPASTSRPRAMDLPGRTARPPGRPASASARGGRWPSPVDDRPGHLHDHVVFPGRSPARLDATTWFPAGDGPAGGGERIAACGLAFAASMFAGSLLVRAGSGRGIGAVKK